MGEIYKHCKCSLAGGSVVAGAGPQKAALVIVGEGAGARELELRRPFVGPSGRLLDVVLQQAGVDRKDVYITNAVLCMEEPPRTPTAKEVKCCSGRLFNEVKARKPVVVLALGKIAMKALLGLNSPIGEERGAVRYSTQLGAYVVPTYHPAAVLRSPRLHRDLLHDIIKARDLATQPVQNVDCLSKIVVEYKVVTTLDGVLKLVEQYPGGGQLAYDVETSSDGSLLCLGVSCEPGKAVVLVGEALQKPHARECIDAWVADKVCVAQNAKFDIKTLWRHGFRGFHTGEDTMLMAYALDASVGGHGLKQLVREYLDFYDDYADSVAPYMRQGLETCPPDVLYKYNAYDAALTFMLANELRKRLDSNAQRLLNELLYPASDVLAQMEHDGVMVDTSYLESLDAKLTLEEDTLTQQLRDLAGVEFNPNSVPQLLNVLYNKLELPVPARISTDKEALKILIRFTGHPFPKLLQEYRGRKKFHTTYVRALLEAADPQGRVHTNFNLHVTTTGRLSSSRPLNLQNVPATEEARNAIIATPGYTLIEGDMSQSEIRCFCFLSRDTALRDALTSGVDIHTATAQLMFGVPADQVTPEQRQAAKRLAFSTLYGQSAQGLSAELECSIQEATDLQNKFFAAYKQGRAWMAEVRHRALADQQHITMFGRKLRYVITPENRAEVLRWAVNYPVQSLSSDITLAALVRLGKLATSGKLGDTRLLITVHDSILLETREDTAQIARVVKQEMEHQVGDGFVPFVTDVKIGKRWGSMERIDPLKNGLRA